MSSADLVRAQYSGYDFDTQSDDLRSRLQVKFASDYNDFTVSALGIMLLDSVAFGLDSLTFYLDRRATDTYLVTARTRKSVSRLTRQLGYKMRAAVASSADLNVTVPNPGFNVTIPKGFQYKGPNSLVFEVAEPVTWLATDTARLKSVPVYEGETVTERFVSDGTPNQVFYLRRVPDQKFVVAGSVTVLVNGSPFSESEFIDFEETDQFEAGYNDDPPTIRFGDGHGAGNVPASGATIVVSYVASRGQAGLVNSGTITTPVNPLVISFQTIAMTTTNPLGSLGGSDPEDLEHAKVYAPRVYKSRNVAVTREDYEALSGSFASPLFGRVAVAQAITARSADLDTALTAQLTTIRNTTDAVLPYAGPEVQLTGKIIDVATDGTVTGEGTLFTSELPQGTYIRFGSDPAGFYRRVTVTPTVDDIAIVTPGPATAMTKPDTLWRTGSEVIDGQAKLKTITTLAAGIIDPVAAASGTLKDIATQTASIAADVGTTIPTKVTEAKNFSTDITSRVNAINTNVISVLSDTDGIDGLPAASLTVSGAVAGDIIFTPKIANLRIRTIVTGGSYISALSTTVVPYTDITLTFPTGTTASVAAGLVVADLAVDGTHCAAGKYMSASTTSGGGSAVQDNGALAVVGTSQLKFDTKDTYQRKLRTVLTQTGGITTSNGGIVSDLTAITNAAANSLVTTGVIGTDPSAGLLLVAQNSSDLIGTLVGNTSGVRVDVAYNPSYTLMQNFGTIQTHVNATYNTIDAACTEIFNHVDQMLNLDCKVNLISVPILATDKAGFYVEPSKGLIRALQDYLDARKEVTQTVSVVSGGDALVKVRVEARVGVKPSYSEAVTGTAVSTAIEGLLRNRKFGEDLYLADLYNSVDIIDGVAFSNIKITAATTTVPDAYTSIDSDGNLILGTGKVITKDPAAGAIAVTTETTTGQ